MKLGIMQPYFFPYIGYWQLIHAVDKFVVYDNIQYTKKGWINRNRILVDGKDKVITLPIKKDSDFLDVRERKLADQFSSEKQKMLKQISAAYKKAPQYDRIFPIVRECIEYREENLFLFLYHSIVKLAAYMGIETELIVSSTVNVDSELKKEKRVKALCKALGADEYLNPMGGVSLYDKEDFLQDGICLNFIETQGVKYQQKAETFVPHLSIIDVLMYNPPEEVQKMLDMYRLV